MSDDGNNTTDAKPASSGKLESMPQEDLIRFIKNQAGLKKKLDAKMSELLTSNVSLCQAEEKLQNELDDEKEKSKALIIELNQSKLTESKLQQELNITRESSECLQLQNDSLKSSCKNLQEELTNVQNDLSNLRLTITNVEQDLTNKLNESQNTIENLLNEKQSYEQENIQLKQSIENNEESKPELDELRSKSNTFDKEKQLMEEQINHFRQQIEEFEFGKSQQQASELPIHQSNENVDEIISQRISSLLSHTDEQEQHISRELSDIPTLLPIIGITNEDFSNSLNLESLLRLCSLLIERCKVLQKTTDKEFVSIVQNDDYEQCRLLIHRQDHSGLDALFEQLYSWMNQSASSNDWQISLAKPIDKDTHQHIRLELNDFKFVSENVEHELVHVRSQLDQLSNENEEQRREINILKENLLTSEQLKDQLVEQQRKTTTLEEDLRSSEQQCTKLQRKITTLEENLHSSEQSKDQLAEQQLKIGTLEEALRSSEEQQQKITALEENLHSAEQLKDQLLEEQRKITTLEEHLRSSEERCTELQRKITALEEDLRSSEEQLAEQRREFATLEGNLHSSEQSKDQLAEQQLQIATLEEALRSSEEQQQKITALEENLHSAEQLKHELLEEQRKTATLEEQGTELQRKITALEENLHSSEQLKDQLVEQQRETSTLEENLRSYEQLKDQLVEEQRKITTLEENIRSSEKQLSEQQQNISTLEENLRSSEQFKEQLTEEREKTNALQSIIDQEAIDKTKFAQLESSYQDLQQKYLLFEQMKSEYNLLKEQQEINDKLNIDRDENIRLLKLEVEQQKQLLDSTNHNKDERYLSLSKQQQQLSDLLETKINENKNLTELNLQFKNDLKENNQLFFEKTKQADDLDRQLQISNEEYKNLKIKFDQLKEDKNKLMEKIQHFEREVSEYTKVNGNLKQKLENNKLNFDQIMKKNEDQTQIENELQQTIENLKQELELTKTDHQLKSTEEKQITLNQSSNLQEENEKLNQTINELNQKIEKQTAESDDLKEKQQKLKILLTRLKKELQEKNQQPKQSLIDLELADYEKTIKTLKDDLTHKDKEIQDLRDEITNLNEKTLSLKQEIENSEQQKSQTEERANKFKTLLDTAKKELQDAKDLEQERHYNDDNVRIIIDKLQIELDDNKVIVSQLLSEKQQLTERLNHQNETTQRTINLLEQNLRIAKHDLDVAKKDYETLEDDYNNYKIRAQSVLKQHQSTQRERIPSPIDKHTDLEETIEKFKITLQEAKHKIELLMSENEALQKEQDRLSEMQTKLVNESRKREQDLRKQHQIELDKMQTELLTRTNDNHDIMKNVALQHETLSSTFKEQIVAIESDHERSISILQNQLQASKQEIEQLKNRIESLRQTNIENEKESPQIAVINEFNKDDLPWTYAERQQGEGSESASTDYQSTDVAVKTLENVLFGNTTNNRSSSSNIDKPRHILFEDAELERQRIEEELNRTKYRLLNTTELLNESELNNVRLSEQVSLLKDEIRRMERNIDRTESISNLEYLKNIILKFFILKSTHERLQLIPVLVTMLKLSPDEQAKLVHVAQQTTSFEDTSLSSESNTQQVTNNANPNSSSWSSYLNIW